MALRVLSRPHRLLKSPRIAASFSIANTMRESFMNPNSSTYIETMYNAWLRDQGSVHISWDAYFKAVNQGAKPGHAYSSPPTITPLPSSGKRKPATQMGVGIPLPTASTDPARMGVAYDRYLDDHLAVQNIIRSYQIRGHLVAACDPLELRYGELYSHTSYVNRKGQPPKRVVRDYMLGTSEDSMNAIYKLPATTFIGGHDRSLSLKVIIERLENAYCRHIGVEFMFINSFTKCQWLRQKFETPGIQESTRANKRLIMKRLVRATGFEAFLARKFVSEKRFGLEGCEVLIPAIKDLIDHSAGAGVEYFTIGMPHRGRLNVVANILRQPLYKLFSQFATLEAEEEGSGDVKYHLGSYVERINRVNNKPVKISIVANPSHLEAVDPVVLGKTRAQQLYINDVTGDKVMAILIHGDAAFCGQGIVYESFHLSDLPDYTTHGSIHIVVNNQIGFTTDPRYSRSSAYCTDVGRVTQAPIFHVNGDDPEAVMYCVKVAVEYRNKFKKDVVIDIVCYRRNGHNEIDEPSFTQPMMYKKIRSMPNTLQKYTEQLLKEGVVTLEEVTKEKKDYDKICEDDFAKAQKETVVKWRDWLDSPWKNFFPKPGAGAQTLTVKPTGVPEAVLEHIGVKFASPPPKELNFECHKGLERVLRQRMEMVQAKTVDWALGEAMAFGSLLKEKIHVRLSGQDVERGTFSHRHHVLHHQSRDMEMYIPLKHLYPDQAVYNVCNSSISEFGVLGFEIGFSMTSPHALILWEAQFGDFNNGGQVMIDQFLAGGESKWIRQTGLVMLNPHGMEGMGPEHSSARLERFLLMSDDDPDTLPDTSAPDFVVNQLKDTNWIVANCTTPANYFHILRRQIALPFRKPLIMMSPKSLLRHPECRSSFSDMMEGTEFQRMIFESGPASKNPANVKKLIFCSGKVYYDLT